MSRASSPSDVEFVAIVARCRSWRHVLRESGSTTTSTSGVRRRATLLGLDVSHFTGQRRWSDAELWEALSSVTSWTEAAIKLGTPAAVLKRHAMRSGAPYEHLDRRTVSQAGQPLTANSKNLRVAGEALATAWLQLAGCAVAQVPGAEPFDLLAVLPDGGNAVKIQVKTTTCRAASGSPNFQLRTKNYDSPTTRTRLPYSEGDVDFFFLIAGRDDMWLVPHARVLGQIHCHPGPEYEPFRVRWPE